MFGIRAFKELGLPDFIAVLTLPMGEPAAGQGEFDVAIGVLSFSYGESGRQRGFYSLPSR